MNLTRQDHSYPFGAPRLRGVDLYLHSPALAAIDRHNGRVHDGAEIARVDPAVTANREEIIAADFGLRYPPDNA